MIMERGKIVEVGSSEDIYHRPQTDYTKKLIEAIPVI
jgi:peptide/nickel transport system ATP-binding protein